jgi:hypothetical protein
MTEVDASVGIGQSARDENGIGHDVPSPRRECHEGLTVGSGYASGFKLKNRYYI